MAGTRTTDSFSEGLHKLLQSVTDLKTTDDADLPFAINLETAILQRLKQGATAAMGGQPPGGATGTPAATLPGAAATTPGAGMVPGGGPGGMPGPVPGMPGPVPAGPAGLPPGPAGPALPAAAVPGLMQGPNFPNPDELRRALATGTMASRLNNVAARLANVIPTSAQI